MLSFSKMTRYGWLLLVIFNFSSVFGAPLDDSANTQWSVLPDGDGKMHVINKRTPILDDIFDNVFFDEEKETIFTLYTPENPDTPQRVILNDRDSLLASNFDPSRPTRFSIHGWINNAKSDVNLYIRQAYLKKGNFNVFVVDWGEGSFSEYSIARNRVDDVGRVVAMFIDFMHDITGVDFSSIYVAGHSLGAHVAGFTGKNVKKGRLPVIFGLDPAYPLFYGTNEDERLSTKDATYVETIHTNALVLGYGENIGNASFYPNYGTSQKGCLTIACDHFRAYEFFAESLYTTTGFFAKQCQDYEEILWWSDCTESGVTALMGGEPARTDRSGVYYLPTSDESPFALGAF